MKDKGNRNDAVGKSSLEQQFCKSSVIIFAVFNIWSCLPGLAAG